MEAEESIAPMPYSEAFSEVISAINTQPYPSNSSGWVIVRSDQVGGFVSAELRGSSYNFFTGSQTYYAVVSVAMVDRGDGQTQVNLSQNTHTEAMKLSDAIRDRLQLR